MKFSGKKKFDVLGLGCTAVDELLYVPSFPASDAKVQVEQRLRRCGGLTGVALVTAARLGARCGYAGCLGIDELSDYVAENFACEGVDCSHAPRLPEARVVRSTIIVSRHTGSRNIFFEIEGMIGAHDSLPEDKILCDSKVLFIDHYGMAGNLRATRAARSAGVAVVADFEDDSNPLFQQVLRHVDHLILSEEFALRITHESTVTRAAPALWQPGRAAVIITCGASGCWSVSQENGCEPCQHPAFIVQASDTTGCGDVFHGAYAASLARGDPLQTRIRFASAAAALKARQGEIPSLPAVEAFLRVEPLRPSGPEASESGKNADLSASSTRRQKTARLSHP